MKKQPQPRMSFGDAMAALEAAGSEQTRKTWRRHGVSAPAFGVSFATLKVLRKRIGVDHELAVALWNSGNYDARNLAAKVADPARFSPAELDRWARETGPMRPLASYVALIAAEGPHAADAAARWIGAEEPLLRRVGWFLLGALANVESAGADAWFEDRIALIERTIHQAPNDERDGMIRALISVGCRDEALRDRAISAARRIGPVEIDQGDTECVTPDVVVQIEKAWAHSTGKGYASPAAHERSREPLRLRC